jgi:recombination protein RecA
MKVAVTRKEIESALHDRFGDVFERHERVLPEILPTDIVEIDNALGGFPRGAITEIHGAPSSGRTSLLLSALAAATAREETCALIDCNDTFDLLSATKAGIDFSRLLWVRCQNNLERAFKAADLVTHAGGFGLVVLNLCDVPAKAVRRILSSWWFRFRRAIENTPTVLIVFTSVACVRSSAAVVLELRNEVTEWRKTVSFVNNEQICDDKRKITRGLSLVSAHHSRGFDGLSLSHAQFIQGLRVRVNRVKPVEPPNSVNFKPQFHLSC